jgi:hypothetical protein
MVIINETMTEVAVMIGHGREATMAEEVEVAMDLAMDLAMVPEVVVEMMITVVMVQNLVVKMVGMMTEMEIDILVMERQKTKTEMVITIGMVIREMVDLQTTNQIIGEKKVHEMQKCHEVDPILKKETMKNGQIILGVTAHEMINLQLNHQKEKNIMMSQLSHQSMKSLHNRCSAKRVGLQLLFHLMKTMEWVVERK